MSHWFLLGVCPILSCPVLSRLVSCPVHFFKVDHCFPYSVPPVVRHISSYTFQNSRRPFSRSVPKRKEDDNRIPSTCIACQVSYPSPHPPTNQLLYCVVYPTSSSGSDFDSASSLNTTTTPRHGNTQILLGAPFALGLDPVPAPFFFEKSRPFSRFGFKAAEPEVAECGDEDDGGQEEFLGAGKKGLRAVSWDRALWVLRLRHWCCWTTVRRGR